MRSIKTMADIGHQRLKKICAFIPHPLLKNRQKIFIIDFFFAD